MLDDVAKDNLHAVLESITLIQDRFSEIERADDFILNADGVLILDAISMRLQIVGELLKTIDKIDNSLFEKYTEIPWEKIIRLRDLISHHYNIVDHEIIFDICKNHIPKLNATVRKVIENEETL